MSNPNTLLAEGSRYRWEGTVFLVRNASSEVVHLPTRAIAIVDAAAAPWELRDLQAALGSVGGSAQVVVTYVEPEACADGGSAVVAGVVAYFSDEPVTSWQLARTKGGMPLRISVDSGMAALLDPSAAERLAHFQDDPELGRSLTEHVLERGWYACPGPQGTVLALVVNCGMGDGIYDCWVGHSDDGRVVALLCDFELLDHLEPTG